MNRFCEDKKHLLYFIVLFTVSIMLFAACQDSRSLEQTPDIPITLTPGPLILWAHPQPDSAIELQDYRAGYYLGAEDIETGEVDILSSVSDAVCIKLDASALVEDNDDGLELEDYLARSELIIDGSLWTDSEPVLLSNELNSAGRYVLDVETLEVLVDNKNAAGPFTIYWEIKLNQGFHQIEFQSRRTSGRLFSYEWSFRIND